MSRKSSAESIRESLDWVGKAVAAYAEGVHRLGAPAYVLDSELPMALAEIYRSWDGLELFHEGVVIRPSRAVKRSGELFAIGHLEGDELFVDGRGRVLRREADTEELVCEGTSVDRWLAGVIDADGAIFDREGEFRDGVATDEGELEPEVAIERERRMLKRDRHAPGPRWRLARLLAATGSIEEARVELERVVDDEPSFSWAWYDLARISEQLGDLDTAGEELEAAATADADYPHVGFFWAHAARIADLRGDESARALAASRALAADPQLAKRQLDGARASLEDGDQDAALELAATARALAPKDLAVLDFLRKLGAR